MAMSNARQSRKAAVAADYCGRASALRILHSATVPLWHCSMSVASSLLIDSSKFMAVGLEINANHLRPVATGIVTGTCTPIHIGSKTHVWDIRITNERGKLVCISRLTVAIIPSPTV